ncbi:Aste57867_12593 [Aphanomyces stellatus]|uniref:Aste57867_12593 protein n=1 Tax=Aphanomyces stellatus TaxID=120398 RepID=A0A485KXC4_9STRA|nr:hypothetical protein As57867_012547 [Aphanomyces stellatus]VFT89444.1 Aste57867_12593 [Aphanomyces stellatus]
MNTRLATLLASLAAVGATTYHKPLELTPYNAGTTGLFPVSSVLVSGTKEAILVNAQFGASQARDVVQIVKDSGKTLTTIYIAHGDPDYYFGLETIHAAFPKANIWATQATVDHINATAADKLKFWGPKLGVNAPKTTILPSVVPSSKLKLEGRSLEIRGPTGRSYVWVPSIKAIVDGVLLVNNIHAFMADTQTPESHDEWIDALEEMQCLEPDVIVPGHALPGDVDDIDAPAYTAQYIRDFDDETPKAANSTFLIAAMTQLYPKAGGPASLEISAAVAKGEMKWP